MGNERTNDTEKELHFVCIALCAVLLLLKHSAPLRKCNVNSFISFFVFSSLISETFVLSLSPSDYFLRVLSNRMTEVLKRGDMSLINCTVSENRSLPNVIEIRINARDAFKCTLRCIALHLHKRSSDESYFTYLILVLLVFGLNWIGLNRFYVYFYILKCVFLFRRFV